MRILITLLFAFFGHCLMAYGQTSTLFFELNNMVYQANIVTIESDNEFVISSDFTIHSSSNPGSCKAKKDSFGATFKIFCGPTEYEYLDTYAIRIKCANTNEDFCVAIPHIIIP